MHRDFKRADVWSHTAIGAAIEVHKAKGSGLIESIYEQCLMRELALQNVPAERQTVVPVEYKGLVFEQPLFLDVYIDTCLILELKVVEAVLPVHKAQLMSYMRLLDAPLGLLINFNEPRLSRGITRLILPGANQPEPGL